LYNWPFAPKLLAQLAACLAVMLCGDVAARLVLPSGAVVPFGLAGVVLTLGWLLFVTNAVNFIDGLNGLAAGSVLIACCLVAAASTVVRFEALALAAGIVGFLPFNYPRARIFMGDVGSQACGFLMADMAVTAARDPLASLVVPLALLPILADVLFTLARRAWTGARLTQAHRGHLYQVAQRAGVPAWLVSALYWAMASWGGLCGVLLAQLGGGAGAAVLACAAAAAPLVGWAAWVVGRARQARIGAW